MGKLDIQEALSIISGIGEACRQAKCALLGGETAEMPGFYQDNEYDLAGFAVGIVDNRKIIDGTDIRVGHRLIGIASSGLHSNGYSLARKICFEKLKLKVDDEVDMIGRTIGEELLEPTKIYTEVVRHLLRDFSIHGIAHITGGGIIENLPRILPDSCVAVIQKGSWQIPPIFTFLQEAGKLSKGEMMRTFNNGIGMIAIVPADATGDVLQRLEAKGIDPCLIPGFIRCLANALCAAPPGDLFQINKQLQYLGWDAFELDYHTLELAATCLETDGLEAHTYKPVNWFEARFNPQKAA